MDPIYFKGFVSSLAVITTIFQFLSGILVCRRYVQNGTTAEASPLPFLCGTLSSGLWLLYGLTKEDDKIILVNCVGLTLMISYTVLFSIYTFKKSSVMKQIFTVIVVFLLVLAYTANEVNHDTLLSRLGLLACSVTLLTIAAPMSKLLYVVKVQNTECLPFPMILMSFFVSLLWYLYGMIIQDTYLIVPNFIGGVLALCQLSLFIIYPSKAPSLAAKPILA